MQKGRRDFAKKTAMLVAGSAVVGSTVVLASEGEHVDSLSNGVVIGKSNKKEILYSKTKAWDDFYKQAL